MMRAFTPSLVFSILTCALLANASSVKTVTRAELDALVKGNGLVLAAFTFPDSEASQTFQSEYELAAAVITSPLVKVDCSAESELCLDQDINAYPALRLFRGWNNTSRYRGPRKSSAIISYMIKAYLPPVTDVTKSNIETFRSIDNAVFIAYLRPQDTELESIFNAAAKANHRSFVFGRTYDRDLADASNLPVPSVVCHKLRDGENEILAAPFDAELFEQFMHATTTPIIGEMTKRNMNDFLSIPKPLAYIFYRTETERDKLRRELRRVAKKYKEYVTFAILDATEYGHIATNLDLRPDAFPAFVLHNAASDQVFPFSQRRKITEEVIDVFVLDVLQGKVMPGPLQEDALEGEGTLGDDHDEL